MHLCCAAVFTATAVYFLQQVQKCDVALYSARTHSILLPVTIHRISSSQLVRADQHLIGWLQLSPEQIEEDEYKIISISLSSTVSAIRLVRLVRHVE